MDGVIESKQSLVAELKGHSCDELFRYGANLKDRCGRDGYVQFEVRVTDVHLKEGASVTGDRDTQTGDLPRL